MKIMLCSYLSGDRAYSPSRGPAGLGVGSHKQASIYSLRDVESTTALAREFYCISLSLSLLTLSLIHI